MSIIKEYVEYNNQSAKRFIVRRSDHGKTLFHLMELKVEIEKDFGHLPNSSFEIVHYAGDRYKGTYGLEFFSDRSVPKEYKQIAQAELTL